MCKEVCRLDHETLRAVQRSECDFGYSTRTGQVVQTIRCCRGHKFEQRKEHRSVVCCNHHSWTMPTKLTTVHERITLPVSRARFRRNMLELSTKVHAATFFKISEQTNRLEKKMGLKFAIEKTAKTKKNMA